MGDVSRNEVESEVGNRESQKPNSESHDFITA